MRTVKTAQQNYRSTVEILDLFDVFRSMVNYCVHVGLSENVTSLKSMSLRAYRDLGSFGAMSYYRLAAISAAVGILRNYRKASRKGQRPTFPCARKLGLTACYGFRISNGNLFLPVKPSMHVTIPLTKHTLETISGHEVRSVTLTPSKLSIAFAKYVVEVAPQGFIGIDRNLNNVTVATACDEIQQIDLTKLAEIRSMYLNIRSKFRRNDTRIRRGMSHKYGVKERAKVQQILHHTSSLIVNKAKKKQYGVVMEKLTGIRRLYRRRNGQGAKYRFRLNSWSYGELQRQIEYKARWEGLPVIYVHPHGTSARCSKCGSRMIPEESRIVRCAACGLTIDRDVNAARNILARGVRFAPVGPPSEAMVQEPKRKVILKVDGGQLACTSAS